MALRINKPESDIHQVQWPRLITFQGCLILISTEKKNVLLYERCVAVRLAHLAAVLEVAGLSPTQAKTGKLALFTQQ